MPVRLVAVLFALGLLVPPLLHPGGAAALRGWCPRDPEVMVGGETIHIHLELGVADLGAARALSTGQPIALTVTAPQGVSVRFLGGDNGLGAGYAFQAIVASQPPAANEPFPITVAAYVPLRDATIPVRVSLIPTASNRAASAGGQGGGPDGRSGDAVLVAGSAAGFANAWVGFTSGQNDVALARAAQAHHGHRR